MSEEQAYYQPQARFVQDATGVWIVEPPDATLAAMGITVGQVSRIDQTFGSEQISYLGNATENRAQGREMVLVPKEPDLSRYIRIVRFRNPANGNWRHSIEIVCDADGGEFMQVDTFYELGIAESFANRLARMTNLPRHGDQLTPVS